MAVASGPGWPRVAVVVPVRNGARDLPGCLAAVLDQDYPGDLEVAVAVGPSNDGTEAVAAAAARRDARVRVVANPSGRTPAALNRAIAATTGAVVARVDAHAALPPGYLRRAVETLRATGADNVGGVQDARGDTPFERAVAAAMSSRFGVGNATFHYGGAPGVTDTVYLGVFRREALDRVGGFDETLERNQDYELNWRLRDSGGVVWFDPALRVRYRPRPTLRALADQYRQYGRWKREVLRRHPASVKARQLAPPAALVANAGGLVLGLAWRRRLLAVPGIYLAALCAASLHAGRAQPPGVAWRLPAVFATMHHAWGWGFLTAPRGLRVGTRAPSSPGP